MTSRLGLIAGKGVLPVEIAQANARAGRDPFVIRLQGLADRLLRVYPGADIPVTEFGSIFTALKAAGCDQVCFSGYVSRPRFDRFGDDAETQAARTQLAAAGRQGDEALLRQVSELFIANGFAILGAHEAAPELALTAGLFAGPQPPPEAMADAEKAAATAQAIGALDIGQAAAVARGLILAVEAQEGTDALLKRIAKLPEAIRGTPEHRCGVLAKLPKPIQDLRLDLPTVGPSTVEGAAKAGLAGIVGAAGRLLIVEQAKVRFLCAEYGVFILGLTP